MPKVIQMPRRADIKVSHRKETPPQDGVTSILTPPHEESAQNAQLRQYEKLAEIALSKPLEEESA